MFSVCKTAEIKMNSDSVTANDILFFWLNPYFLSPQC